ncbi:hypothetical protein U91I_02383 [alpha proteobacterium U9-1i]|nr:hypothetical protein U91I_02383 [alpha proteobacterium U9-1i]
MALFRTALVGLVFLASGCASQPGQPVGRTVTCDASALRNASLPPGPALEAQLPGTFTPIPLNQVTMLEPGMARWLMVQTVGATRTPTNTVQVVARVVNCTDQTVQIEGRTHFLTSDQMATEPVSAWKRVIIPPRSIGSYQEMSVDATRVGNYLIELREGR